MKEQNPYGNLIRFGFALVVWSAVTVAWGFVWFTRYAEYITQPFYYRGNLVMVGIYGLLLYFFTAFYNGYRVGYHKQADVIFSCILALIIVNIITYAQTSLLSGWFASPQPILIMTAVQASMIILWGLVVGSLCKRIFAPQKLLMVYGGETLADNLHRKMLAYPENYSIQDSIDIGEGYEKACTMIREYSGVILCDIPSAQRNDLIKYCFNLGIRTYTTPKIPDIIMRGATEESLFDTPLLFNSNNGLSLEQRFVKRLMDIVLSVIGLILAIPLMIPIALVVKLYDHGPVIYKQQRLTRNGKVFWLYKFRSMIVNAEKHNGAQLAVEGDNRITPVGKIIRRFRMDELPQLICIICGHMSVVGPRPERPELAEEFLETMPEFDYRLKVKAGLTGLAQSMGRYNTTAYDKLRLDLFYIANYSLLKDFVIILMTVKVLLEKKSTEGTINILGESVVK